MRPGEPSDDDLRGYLLGTLPAEQVEFVRVWLEAEHGRVSRLDRLWVHDPLTEAISADSTEQSVPVLSIERVVRRASDSLHKLSGGDDTFEFSESAESQQTSIAPLGGKLGDYRIIREIGRGGMGVVLEMSDPRLGRRVAAKVLNPEYARRPEATARFLREARHAATVEHENVVPILHVGEEEGMPYIVMPLLKGESLAERLRRPQRLTMSQVMGIGRDIASGLAAAHARGLVHRDMKPGNVWLDETGRARILDFGLARQENGGDAVTESGALVGTPAYMSPEQIDGQEASPRSDLFALGAILYECSTGQRAFDGPSVSAILKAVGTKEPVPVSELNKDIPPSVAALIGRLLDKDPARRPAKASEVALALTGVPGPPSGIDVATREWVPGEASGRPKRRVVLWLAAGLAMILLAGVGIWAFTGGSGPRNQEPPGPADQAALGKTEPPVPKNDKKSERGGFHVSDSPSEKTIQYRGKLDVLVSRRDEQNKESLLRLDQMGALPLKSEDAFRIEGVIEPPAYVYLIWVDPEHDITPVYPWNPKKGWGTRPPRDEEEKVSKLSLPKNVGKLYTAPDAKPGVATMVLFARREPLDVSDEEIKRWFEALPDLPLPPGGNKAAIWFDDYVECRDPLRLRTFGEVGSNDAFARWQGQLQKSLKNHAAFETAVSFARTGNP